MFRFFVVAYTSAKLHLFKEKKNAFNIADM